MAIVAWPENSKHNVYCVVCNQYVDIGTATAGLLDIHSKQAFACSTHLVLSESGRFLRAWVDFTVSQTPAGMAVRQ